MKNKVKYEKSRLIPVEWQYTPVFPEDGDEIYCSGVFFFNVSALLKWLEQNPQQTIDMPITIWGSFSAKEDCYVEIADLNRPIVIAEIAPDYRDFIPDIPEEDWRS